MGGRSARPSAIKAFGRSTRGLFGIEVVSGADSRLKGCVERMVGLPGGILDFDRWSVRGRNDRSSIRAVRWRVRDRYRNCKRSPGGGRRYAQGRYRNGKPSRSGERVAIVIGHARRMSPTSY